MLSASKNFVSNLIIQQASTPHPQPLGAKSLKPALKERTLHFKKDIASSMRKAAFVKFKSPVTSPALWIRQVCMAMRFQTWQKFSPCEANKNPVKTIQNLWHGS